MLKQPLHGGKVILFLLVMIMVPVGFTLHSVQDPVKLLQSSPNPTPYGYTISLLLFLVPMVFILISLSLRAHIQIQKRASLLTVAILAPAGIILDILFGNVFFNFHNHGAVTGIMFPAVGGPLPVEELIFYISGFITILLIYVWCDEVWFEKYNVADYKGESASLHRIFEFHPLSLLAAIGIMICAVLYKKLLSSSPDGFPGYMIYLTIVALAPAMVLYNAVKKFINWRALSFTMAIVVLLSLIWEVTLALPYQWWGFNESAMMGIHIKAWHNLPVEEVILWISVSYATVTTYESIKIWKAQNKPFKQAMFGLKD